MIEKTFKNKNLGIELTISIFINILFFKSIFINSLISFHQHPTNFLLFYFYQKCVGNI